MTRKMKKSAFIQLRVTSERKAAIIQKAHDAGLSVTNLIDQALDEPGSGRQKINKRRGKGSYSSPASATT